jgi:hypothetical protein
MAALFRNRRWLVFVCLGILLWMMLAPGAAGLPFAPLAPLWICFGLILCVAHGLPDETCAPQPVLAFPRFITRAPPRAC